VLCPEHLTNWLACAAANTRLILNDDAFYLFLEDIQPRQLLLVDLKRGAWCWWCGFQILLLALIENCDVGLPFETHYDLLSFSLFFLLYQLPPFRFFDCLDLCEIFFVELQSPVVLEDLLVLFELNRLTRVRKLLHFDFFDWQVWVALDALGFLLLARSEL
jgi:hypothetical protein